MLDRALEFLMNIGFGVLAKELKSQPGLRIEDLLMKDAVTSRTHPTASCARVLALHRQKQWERPRTPVRARARIPQ